MVSHGAGTLVAAVSSMEPHCFDGFLELPNIIFLFSPTFVLPLGSAHLETKHLKLVCSSVLE